MKSPMYQESEQARPVSVPSVDTRPVPGAFGAGLAQGAVGLAQGLDQVAAVQEQFKHEADISKVTDNVTALQNKWLDHKAALDRLEGDAAIKYGSKVGSDLEKVRDSLSSNEIYNQAQAAMFKQQSAHILLTAKETVNSHIAKAVSEIQDASDKSAEASSMRAIAVDPTDDKAYEDQKARMDAIYANRAARKVGRGTPEGVQALTTMQQAWAAEALGTRLDILAKREDAEGIQKLWEQKGTRETLGKLAPHFEALVQETIRKNRSYSMAQDILNNTPLAPGDPDVNTVNEKQALAKVYDPARKIPVADRMLLRQQVLQGIEERKVAQQQQNTSVFNHALQSIFGDPAVPGSGGIDKVSSTDRAYLQNPNNGGDLLWVRAEKVARSLLEDGYNVPPTLPQIAIAGRLRASMAENWPYWAAQDPGVLYTMYAGKGDQGLTPQQLQTSYAELAQTKKEADVRMGQGVGPVALAEILRQGRRAHLFAEGDPKTWNDEQSAIFNQISDEVQKKEYAERRSKQGPVGYLQIQEWVREAIKPGAIPGGGFLTPLTMPFFYTNKNVSRAEYLANPELQQRGPWIPENEMAEITKQLGVEKTPVTPENIIKLYKRARGQH